MSTVIGTANSLRAKPELKEKFVQIYDSFFRGEDPSKDHAAFWDELFLLKVNVPYLEQLVDQTSSDNLLKMKESLNVLFAQCSATLASEHCIRRVNALQTLCVLVRCVFRKGLTGFGFEVIDILVGFDQAEVEMRKLLDSLSLFLTGDFPGSLKNLTLKFLLILVTAMDNISQNTMLEYLMLNSIFDPLGQILANPSAREKHGYDCVLLLTFLLNYRKYEAANPYILKLSVLDNELVLNGLGVIVTGVLSTINKKYAAEHSETPGWFGRISTWVGGMFVASDEIQDQPREAHSVLLLSLYEAVHLNRNFITILTQTHSQVPSSPAAESSSPAMTDILSGQSDSSLANQTSQKSIQEPVNLLGAFLTSSSICMLDIKEGGNSARARLCLDILTCICEDQYANAFLHDNNMAFPVRLYRAPRRHRPNTDEVTKSRPLACFVLDLALELMTTHLCRKLQVDLYSKAMGIVQRLLCYQKRCRIRLSYSWSEFWNGLMTVGKFLAAHDAVLLPCGNIFDLASQIVNFFNLFITYGDTFLPSPTSYDELYYEMIRMHQVFENLYAMALRHKGTNNAYNMSASKLASYLGNIRAIISHFIPKVDSFTSSSRQVSLDADQIMEIIRSNYGTLTLKLQDNLDYYERYSEKPLEKSFFTQQVRAMVAEVRQNITLSSLEQHSVLQEFSSIS